MNQIEQLQLIIAGLAAREPDSEQIACLEHERDHWKQRAEEAEAHVQQHSEEIERLVIRVVHAEADHDRIKAHAHGWKTEADNAKTEREAWEENHQILSEHFQRMTERAETAESQLRTAEQTENSLKWQLWQACTRLEGWKNDDAQIPHDDHEWRILNDRIENADAAREEATRLMIETTSRAKRAENRAAAWWQAAKTLCRQRTVCNNAASTGWHTAFEHRQRAVKAEDAASQWGWGTSALHERHRANHAEQRAAAWWQAAKRAVRERNECSTTHTEDRRSEQQLSRSDPR